VSSFIAQNFIPRNINHC